MMNGFSFDNDFMSLSDTDKIAVHMGDGWCTFPDLDNFDSQKLLRALTLKVTQLRSCALKNNTPPTPLFLIFLSPKGKRLVGLDLGPVAELPRVVPAQRPLGVGAAPTRGAVQPEPAAVRPEPRRDRELHVPRPAAAQVSALVQKERLQDAARRQVESLSLFLLSIWPLNVCMRFCRW